MTASVVVVDEFGFYVNPQSATVACLEHGEYERKCYFGNVWTGCPECSSRRDASKKAKDELNAKSASMADWLRRVDSSGIPNRFRDRTLASYIAKTDAQRKALEFATCYASEFNQVMQTGRSALFVGRPGAGKTHLATGIALDVMRRWGSSVLFTTALRAIRRIKDTWHHSSQESESRAITALSSPDLLILDEVGIQFGSDAEKIILFDILNDRYEQRYPTLFLSNLTIPEVQGYLGERVFDRLREDGGEVIVFDWTSHRGTRSATKASLR